jgi:CubicO group peptidase (beta-lactamase class C family)
MMLPLVRARLHATAIVLLLAVLLPATALAQTAPRYVPPPGDAWERRTPEQVGLNPDRVREAIELAVAAESTSPTDLLENHRRSFGREPHGEAVGPFKDRGAANGVIVRHGYLVAEWGDTRRVDVTFSVTKSFVSTTVGIAWDRGLIPDLHAPVRNTMAPIVALVGAPGGHALVPVPASAEGPETATYDRMLGQATSSDMPGVAFAAFEVLQPFESAHNRTITWDHLLRQTSDWQGTLWGKPDWADRPRGDLTEWRNRPRDEPGTVYAYNDVRVNLLALAALDILREPLPQVLKQSVMDPIGASTTWRWYGYDNSWVVLDGRLVQSVSGGAHWGGGMFISARDMARFGLLTARRGRWGERQVISEEWIRNSTTPGVNETYGYMNFFLNTGRRQLPSAPEEAFYHLGAGNNAIYVDPVNDIVIVARWINNLRSLDGMIQRVMDGMR